MCPRQNNYRSVDFKIYAVLNMKNYTEYVILHDTSVSSTTPNLTTCRLKTDSAAFHVSILRNPNICHKNPKILLKIPKIPSTETISTRSSAIAEGPRDASCQLKSCQLLRNSAETTCTTSPELIEATSWRVKVGRCVINMCTQPSRVPVAFIVL